MRLFEFHLNHLTQPVALEAIEQLGQRNDTSGGDFVVQAAPALAVTQRMRRQCQRTDQQAPEPEAQPDIALPPLTATRCTGVWLSLVGSLHEEEPRE